jgi:hypothetical protein
MAGLATAGHAVKLAENGQGQALVFPYFTVRDGNETVLTLTNTTDRGKALKVLFREGRNGRLTLSFNLYLSPYDVWTAGLSANALGALLRTTDTSCTVPSIPSAGVPLRNILYTGANADSGPTDLDRTREGYVEVVEMGVVEHAQLEAKAYFDDAITHVSGVPRDCAAVNNAWTTGGAFKTNVLGRYLGLSVPSGGIRGTLDVINVSNSTNFNLPPLVFDAFRNAPAHTAPNVATPNLSSALPKVGYVSTGAGYVKTDWSGGNPADPVSALMMRVSVNGGYIDNDAVAARSAWVVSFPTKPYYVGVDLDTDSDYTDLNYERPFSDDFGPNPYATESMNIYLFGREEDTVAPVPCEFSPCPPVVQPALGHVVNVVAFGDSGSALNLGSQLGYNLVPPFSTGWSKFMFQPNGRVDRNGVPSREMVSTNQVHFEGLPVIGIGLNERTLVGVTTGTEPLSHDTAIVTNW